MEKTITITERPELKTSELIALCKTKFKVWSWRDDWDRWFPAPTQKTYRVFRDQIEADEGLKNLSVNDLKKRGGEYMTFRERIIMELEYFERTGKHLDLENYTICPSSPWGGNFPCLVWFDGRLGLRTVNPDGANDYWRAREVVSLTLEPLNSNPSVCQHKFILSTVSPWELDQYALVICEKCGDVRKKVIER